MLLSKQNSWRRCGSTTEWMESGQGPGLRAPLSKYKMGEKEEDEREGGVPALSKWEPACVSVCVHGVCDVSLDFVLNWWGTGRDQQQPIGKQQGKGPVSNTHTHTHTHTQRRSLASLDFIPWFAALNGRGPNESLCSSRLCSTDVTSADWLTAVLLTKCSSWWIQRLKQNLNRRVN